MNLLKQLYQMVKTREAPGFTKQRAAAVVTSLTGVAVTLGVLPPLANEKVASAANIAISALFIVWGAVHAIIALLSTQHTTPVSDPRDNQGRSLVPAASSSAFVPTASAVSAPTPVTDNMPTGSSATDPSLLPPVDPISSDVSAALMPDEL